ncbi:diaminopropionate ammonia-lyase [Nocardioides terrae]|uniref:Diaminopropionate ammonia-lyase n=1 Tax=Nocardioides terrae TaxID=574651 RepID=A0A1I1N917_9ACTN|nr:diaminopropionate ammonia-lyase [Nocardioides terrae]SFC93955.1 diaminopropionate ammonia-lyase [Nocardioides terrae]
MSSPRWYVNPSAREWRTPPPRSARKFHQALPGYRSTPLTSLPSLAAELGVGHVLLKDESHRLGLPAFKILGASWATCRALAESFELDVETISVGALKDHIGTEVAPERRPVLVTATDGNHGRAVARVAAMLGLAARVYVPSGVGHAAIEAIRGEGAELILLSADYDDAVLFAARSTEESDVDVLVQDTSWEGYVDVPRWIVDGYTTLFQEVDETLSERGLPAPALVACPVGVGAFAHAMVDHYRSGDATPSLLSVEPDVAACLAESLLAGELTTVKTDFTVMAGMNCGTPSTLAWPTLAAGIDSAVSVSDEACRRAVADLADLGQDVGPCGASTLAGVRQALASCDRRELLGVEAESVVVLISTEGSTANSLL